MFLSNSWQKCKKTSAQYLLPQTSYEECCFKFQHSTPKLISQNIKTTDKWRDGHVVLENLKFYHLFWCFFLFFLCLEMQRQSKNVAPHHSASPTSASSRTMCHVTQQLKQKHAQEVLLDKQKFPRSKFARAKTSLIHGGPTLQTAELRHHRTPTEVPRHTKLFFWSTQY